MIACSFTAALLLPAATARPRRCMCHECAQELRKQTSKCPICRNQVESLLHIKMYKGPKPLPQQALTERQVAEAKAANAAAEAAAAAAAQTAQEAAGPDAVPVVPRV